MRYLEKKNAIRMISTRRVAERYPLHYLVWYNKYKELEKELSTKQVGDVCVCVLGGALQAQLSKCSDSHQVGMSF